MKCFVAILLLALLAIAMAEKRSQAEKIDATREQANNAARDKRGLLVDAPFAYTGYGYGYPYAYSTYGYPIYRYRPYYYTYPYIHG